MNVKIDKGMISFRDIHPKSNEIAIKGHRPVQCSRAEVSLTLSIHSIIFRDNQMLFDSMSMIEMLQGLLRPAVPLHVLEKLFARLESRCFLRYLGSEMWPPDTISL